MKADRHPKLEPDQAIGGTGETEAADMTLLVHGNERLRAIRDRHPELADAVAARRAELRQADRDHARGLAMIRQAANLTQTELASILGVGQAAVAKIENRPDLLLSTLRGYLEALGGQARVIVDFDNGASRIEVALDALVRKERAAPPDSKR